MMYFVYVRVTVGCIIPAMHQNWSSVDRFAVCHDSLVEMKQRTAMLGHSVVGPGCKMELFH